jgi:hypothetical protein
MLSSKQIGGNSDIVHETGHNHAPDFPDNEIKKHMDSLEKQVVEDISTPISHMYNDMNYKIKDSGLDKVKKISTFENIKKKLYRKRYKSLGIKKCTFKNAVDVVIPPKFSYLLFADYTYNSKRILVFSCNELRSLLPQCKEFYIDGTFKSCQRNFYQLVTIHADLGSDRENIKVVPVLYALLPNKRKETYEILFKLIKSQVPDWNPTSVKVDFEKALIAALINTCQSIQIQGCFYHFTKCLWTHAKACGINKTKLGKAHVRRLAALAYLPFEHLLDGWLYALEESPKTKMANKFNSYFYDNWMDPKSMYFSRWTCYRQFNRTNNAIEGWHAKVNKLLKPKPDILKLIVVIQRLMRTDVNKLKDNNFSKRKSEIIDVNDRIHDILMDLEHNKKSLSLCVEHLRL